MGWARVAPSRCLLLSIIVTTTVTVCSCVASCVMLWLAPQVPYSNIYCGGDYIRYPALFLAAIALLSALSLFLGACGMSRDSRAALIVYCVILVVIAIGELVGSGTIFTFAYSGKLETVMGDELGDDVMKFHNSSPVVDRINQLQSKYKCCGVESYKDWNNNKTIWERKEASKGQLAPESCCKEEFAQFNCTFNATMIYHTGCVDVLIYRTDIAIDCILVICILAALLNTWTILLSCRAIMIIRRYQNYTVI